MEFNQNKDQYFFKNQPFELNEQIRGCINETLVEMNQEGNQIITDQLTDEKITLIKN